MIISLFSLLWQRLGFGARAWALESDSSRPPESGGRRRVGAGRGYAKGRTPHAALLSTRGRPCCASTRASSSGRVDALDVAIDLSRQAFRDVLRGHSPPSEPRREPDLDLVHGIRVVVRALIPPRLERQVERSALPTPVREPPAQAVVASRIREAKPDLRRRREAVTEGRHPVPEWRYARIGMVGEIMLLT